MKVVLPPALRSYSKEKSEVQAIGKTLTEVLADLDRRYPGLRFRIIDEQEGIRPHIKIFINQTQTKNINETLDSTDKILIICALSGG